MPSQSRTSAGGSGDPERPPVIAGFGGGAGQTACSFPTPFFCGERDDPPINATDAWRVAEYLPRGPGPKRGSDRSAAARSVTAPVSYHPHSGWLDEGPPRGPRIQRTRVFRTAVADDSSYHETRERLCPSLTTVSRLVNLPVHLRETVTSFTPGRQSLLESRRLRRRLTLELVGVHTKAGGLEL